MASPRHEFAPYHFIVTLPDRLYPFRNQIQGQWVRGVRSYDAALARAYRKYGAGHYSYGLTIYRTFFHILGAFVILAGATFIAHRLFGGTAAIATLLIVAMLFITYQEFVMQRRAYRQLWRKGFIDWLAWCGPILFFGFFR